MRIKPVKNQEVESTPNLASKEDIKPKFLSVDRNQRWPVQGRTSGNDYILDAESAEELAGRRSRREFTLDQNSRWPLQGWCKVKEIDTGIA